MAALWQRQEQSASPSGPRDERTSTAHLSPPPETAYHEMGHPIAAEEMGYMRWSELEKRRKAVADRLPGVDPDPFVRRDAVVIGAFQSHRFDFEVKNGRPLDLVRSISFETQNPKWLQNEIDAVAWAIDDVVKASVAPVTIVSMGAGRSLAAAESVYTKLGANFVREADIEPWLDATSSRLLLALEADAATPPTTVSA